LRTSAVSGDVARLDPLARWFPGGRGTDPELGFLLAGFAYLGHASGRLDSAFARLFLQTPRLRVLFYRHRVQRPMTPGLQWFTRTYARLSAPRRPLQLGSFVNAAVRLAGPGLRSLELRIVPDNNMSSLVRTVEAIDAACHRLDGIEVGVVF